MKTNFLFETCVVAVESNEISSLATFDTYFLPSELVERDALKELKKVDWTISRLAAKFLLKKKFESIGDLVSWQQIEIKKNDLGVVGEIKTTPQKSMSISISHTKGRYGAAAVVAEGYDSVGVDIETIRVFPDDFLLGFLTKNEYKYLSSLCQTQRSIHSTAMWSLKEAYFKAQKSSMYKNPKAFETVEFMDRSSVSYESSWVKWTLFESDSILAEIQYKASMI